MDINQKQEIKDFIKNNIEHVCKFEEDIGFIKGTLKSLDVRINGSFDIMNKHVVDGEGWRRAILGIIVTIIIQCISFAYLFGILWAQAENNKASIARNTQIIIDLVAHPLDKNE